MKQIEIQQVSDDVGDSLPRTIPARVREQIVNDVYQRLSDELLEAEEDEDTLDDEEEEYEEDEED